MSTEKRPDPAQWSCPVPGESPETVQLAHGGGGRFSQKLIESVFVPALRNPALEALHDGAVLTLPPGRIAFSSDSFVISPIFFPGGDIGSLAVHGTVNDLAMCGARPLHLSAAYIIEEGLPMADLKRIAQSMGRAAAEAGVSVVTGDTKVVDRGKGDGVFINTSGIGVIPEGVEIAPTRARAGDVVLVSGEIAVHGIAILSVRQGLQFETEIVSDSAPLNGLVDAALKVAGSHVHVLRDPTRGGVASALNEIAALAQVGIELHETAIPVNEAVKGACEILGFDPLYVANEGKCIAIVARSHAEAVLDVWRGHPLGAGAAIIGEVCDTPRGRVVLRTRIGAKRVVDMLSGEQLPRIC
ncbi:MAG: hydrogenase expression/formation protein HypE [Candidatus Krumholzibacteria bacterium]|nr:hydrogenase expression/formation protein HypE [Candidatus Krumholzibacteria bacterium]MDH4338221.1 hydrogenase expression/formation protein HypE [Candidatus Krumholzibacteria bacterium]MDH5271380.1 hydrogenase expression/formation protein HypE [Candidatus Krumholzibacteria bacterium]